MSLLQLRGAERAGVDCIAATSHFNPYAGSIEEYLMRRQKSWEMLQASMTPEMPRIILGAEVLICNHIDKMEGFMSLAFGGSSVVLIEMPCGEWTRDLIYTVEKVNERCNGRAVIAHVDRYDRKSVEYLFDMGVGGQVNVAALCHLFRRRYLMKWIEQGYVVALGSDIHRGENIYRKFGRTRAILGDRFNSVMQSAEQHCFPVPHFIK